MACNVGSGEAALTSLLTAFVIEPREKHRMVHMRAVPEHGKAESKKPYRILMILDQPFPPDIRVENEACALAKAGFEVILLILAPDTRAPIEDYQGYTIVRRHVPQKSGTGCEGLPVRFHSCPGTLRGKSNNCESSTALMSFMHTTCTCAVAH